MALHDDIRFSLSYIDKNVTQIEEVTKPIQKKIYDIVLEELFKFDTIDGNFVGEQDLSVRLASLGDRIERALKVSPYSKSINSFLSSFKTIQDNNVNLQKTYNDLKVDVSLLNPSRNFIYEQAKYNLIQAVAPQYVQPIKFLVMQQVTGAASITQALKQIERWNNGELANGKFTNKIRTPNLEQYATQLARDSAYSVDRTINSIIEDRYGLDHFIYVGTVIQDSRPLCRELVARNAPIPYSDLPKLIAQYPDGLIAGTNKQNFTQVCGGYNCRHKAFPVKNNTLQ